MRTTVATLMAGAASAVIIAGCGGGAGASGALIVDSVDNVIKVTSDKADGTAATGDITVKENDYVIFSPNLTEGSIEVRMVPDKGSTADEDTIPSFNDADVVFEKTYSGRVLSNETIAPGDYYVLITADKADGSMIITSENKDEFEKQNEDLQKELDNLMNDVN